MPKAIIWLRNDLRVHDNEILAKASAYDEVLTVYEQLQMAECSRFLA